MGRLTIRSKRNEIVMILYTPLLKNDYTATLKWGTLDDNLNSIYRECRKRDKEDC